MTPPQKVNVFVSYSHVDKPWLERLKVHLKPLERKGKIELWSDKKIDPGKKWKAEVEKALKESVVAILLISADFLASDFIDSDELPPLLAAAAKEETVILPIIIGHCSFTENESLSIYQAVNSPDEPLEGMTKSECDAVFNSLHKSILGILKTRDGKKNEPGGNATISSTKLRTQPIQGYSEQAVKAMLKDKGFFDTRMNSEAPGFSHKYKVQKDGKVVYDHASGLMWQQSGSAERMAYKEVKAYINALNSQGFAGYHDWRLPTLEEAMSLMEPTKMNADLYIDSKFDTGQRWIWTSDTIRASSAWVVNFGYGGCSSNDFSYNYVRAVR